MTLFVVTRHMQDPSGNLRSVGERIEMRDDLAAPYRARFELMTPEEWEADKAATLKHSEKATYEFHHYERP